MRIVHSVVLCCGVVCFRQRECVVVLLDHVLYYAVSCVLQYYADLYQLVLGELGEAVRQTVQEASPVFIHTIHHVLKSASVISYC